MSEIRDRTHIKIASLMRKYFLIKTPEDITDQILSIKELAIVDREAKLPECPTKADETKDIEIHRYKQGYRQAQQDMLKEGWVKEIKE